VTIDIANPVISERAREAVDQVLQSGALVAGSEVEAFEREFATYTGVEHSIATSSGTSALHTMLEAAGIGAGDAVITTPFSFVASANAVVHAGATPVFADIDPETYNLDPAAVRTVLEAREDVVAILAVHLYGLPAPVEELRSIADEYDVDLYEDAAQAHGATVDGTPVGSLGTAASFSFYPTKNMTTGEGGMITTDDHELARRAQQLINHGRNDKYEHVRVGYNYRMMNVQAAIGRDQLERLPEWVKRRQEYADRLTSALSGIDGITAPTTPDGRTHSFHQYTVRVEDRETLVSALSSADIGYGIYYPKLIPHQEAYEYDGQWPVAEAATESVLSLPVHPNLSIADLETIIDVAQTAMQGGR